MSDEFLDSVLIVMALVAIVSSLAATYLCLTRKDK